MRRSELMATLASSILVAVGCSTNETGDRLAGQDGATASFAIGGSSFAGNSIRICGSRPPPDDKYHCNSTFPAPPPSDPADCPCYNFAADGSIIDPQTNGPLVVNGLCSSNDTPAADWTFSYAIFESPNCGGTQLNDGDHNFTCFDVNDLVTRDHPNQSVEPLTDGRNENHVLCITKNASKTWDFDSCSITTTAADCGVDATRLDCGCGPVNGTCSCGEGGVTPEDLPAGCLFDATSCEIVCSSSDKFACDNTIYVSSATGTSTDLFTINPNTLDTAPVDMTNQFGYDAIGFNHLDGFIYGISNRNAAPGETEPRLVRVNRQGVVTDLGTIPALAGKEWIVGTFIQDGTYVIGAFNSHDWLRLDVSTSPPTVVESGSIGPFIPSAWAANPIDNKIYGFQFVEGGKISVFDLNPVIPTFTVRAQDLINTATNQPVGQVPCSAAFKQQGGFLLYCKTSDPNVDTIYSVNLANNEATPLASKPPLGAGDMASCVFPQ